MIVALAVVAVLAIAFLIMFALAKRSAAEFRTQADAREAALVAERDQLKETSTRQAAELTDASDEITKLTDQVRHTTSEVRRLSDDLEKARALGAEQQSTIESQSTRIEVLEADKAALGDRASTAEAAAAAAAARNVGIVVGDEVDVGSPQPETLWALELIRSGRTWRTSVAPNPSADDDPFEGSDDVVRRAIEIEAAALRENVGAFITIDWRAPKIAEPARQHLVVRVAQELLETAARCPEPSRLVVSGKKQITLRLEAAEDADELANIIPPRISSELVDVRDESGLSITVKAP